MTRQHANKKGTRYRDVIWNVLPKYWRDEVQVDNDEYARDIERIRSAFDTDSKAQREKLLAALRNTTFVMVVDAGDGTGYVDQPGNVYLATDRLKQLFVGVPNVMIVDDAYDCLRGEGMRELLEACGAVRYPRPVEAPHALTFDERTELRRQAGHEQTSGVNDQIEDWELQGFKDLLDALPTLLPGERAERARLIWESLGDLEERRGRGIFDGLYKWSHYGSYRKEFPTTFMRRLQESEWVPDANGELQQPRLVVFDTLGWKDSPFLLTKIAFKPPIIDQLAKEAGIDPAALDLLRKLGITSVADLTARLGITEPSSEPEGTPAPAAEPSGEADVYDAAKDLYGNDIPDIPPGPPDPSAGDEFGTRGGSGGGNGGGQRRAGSGRSQNDAGGQRGGGSHEDGAKSEERPGKRTPGKEGGRPFISYIGTHTSDDEPDPDGLDQATRMRIENDAIEKIIQLEPALRRTPEGNPGYDLYEANAGGMPIRWVEVKSMTGSLVDRPVGLSRTQFDFARDKGSAYWLYVVERANDAPRACVRRIQDPIGHARTFTFDQGWIAIARTDPPA